MEQCKKHMKKACGECGNLMKKGFSYKDLKAEQGYTEKSEAKTYAAEKAVDSAKAPAKVAGAMRKSEPSLNAGMTIAELRQAEKDYNPESEILAKTEALAATGNKELIQKTLAKIKALKGE